MYEMDRHEVVEGQLDLSAGAKCCIHLPNTSTTYHILLNVFNRVHFIDDNPLNLVFCVTYVRKLFTHSMKVVVCLSNMNQKIQFSSTFSFI